MRFPLATRLSLLVVLNVVGTAVATFLAFRVAVALDVSPSFRDWAMALLIALPLGVWSAHRVARSLARRADAMSDGLRALQESDFSIRVAGSGADEIGDLVRVYNEAADRLRSERNDIYQRELFLDAILQRSPIAVVMVNAAGRIVYSNAAAREMFARGGRLDGSLFPDVEELLVPELREALRAGGDAIFSARVEERDETFRLSQRVVHLNTQQHRLVLLERLTPELRRQEVNVWKKAIRVINHELNNSLAPVSSLFHSASLVQQRPDQQHRLAEIYDAIEERLEYLRRFLEGYARFARLPQPRKELASWRRLLDEVQPLYPFAVEGDVPGDGFFDPGQMQQVLINLLKNAAEAGSERTEVSIETSGGGTRLRVIDRGRGMSEATMRQAILPFYSTKEGGTGLGLALCAEILEAHGGRLRLESREGGGLTVTCWIPNG